MYLCLTSAMVIFALIMQGTVFALDDAQVLPKGVRRLMVNTIHTAVTEKTDQHKQKVPLCQALQRDLRFSDFVAVRKGLERAQLESFLMANNISPDEVVGRITADLKARVNVVAPSLGFGITDRLSMGFVVPVIRAATDVSLGFTPNQKAQDFVNLLADPENGQTHKAHEAVDALQGVPDTFNDKLEMNGYDKLGRWEKTGVGDLILKGKYFFTMPAPIRLATNFGLNLPTGYMDSPDNLTDIGFGDGSTDLFLGFTFDQMLFGPFFVNENFQYTAQLPATKQVRMKTAAEPIEVEKKLVTYDLGDKIDAGLSFQWDTYIGFVGGMGYVFQHKFKDQYQAAASSKEYERETTETAHLWESSVGYSGVNAYRRNQLAVPFATSVSYLKQLQSRNARVGDRLQLEAKVFF